MCFGLAILEQGPALVRKTIAVHRQFEKPTSCDLFRASTSKNSWHWPSLLKRKMPASTGTSRRGSSLVRRRAESSSPSKPKWRNWQTRQVQDLVLVKGVQVQVLSSALQKARIFPGFLRFTRLATLFLPPTTIRIPA